MFFNQPFRFTNLVMLGFVTETFLLPVIVPTALIGLTIRYTFMTEEGFSGDGWIFSWLIMNIVLALLNISNVFVYIVY